MIRTLARLRRDAAGSAVVEFAMLAPVFLTMLFGVLQIGVWMQAYNAMRNAMGEASRSVSVEYQTGNKLTLTQIAQVGMSVATRQPYNLDENETKVIVETPLVQRVPGARELKIKVEYQMPTLIGFAGVKGPKVSFTRPIFVEL